MANERLQNALATAIDLWYFRMKEKWGDNIPPTFGFDKERLKRDVEAVIDKL
jgi:hypothetical protein